MNMNINMNTHQVQRVTKASSDQLLRKFAQVGSESDNKKASANTRKDLQLQLNLSKRRKRNRINGEPDHCQGESPSKSSAKLVERKSLLPPTSANHGRSLAAVIRYLGNGRPKLSRAGDFRNKSIFGTIEKTWRRTVEGASKVFMENHYNRHKRLINDIV